MKNLRTAERPLLMVFNECKPAKVITEEEYRVIYNPQNQLTLYFGENRTGSTSARGSKTTRTVDQRDSQGRPSVTTSRQDPVYQEDD